MGQVIIKDKPTPDFEPIKVNVELVFESEAEIQAFIDEFHRDDFTTEVSHLVYDLILGVSNHLIMLRST